MASCRRTGPLLEMLGHRGLLRCRTGAGMRHHARDLPAPGEHRLRCRCAPGSQFAGGQTESAAVVRDAPFMAGGPGDGCQPSADGRAIQSAENHVGLHRHLGLRVAPPMPWRCRFSPSGRLAAPQARLEQDAGDGSIRQTAAFGRSLAFHALPSLARQMSDRLDRRRIVRRQGAGLAIALFLPAIALEPFERCGSEYADERPR